MTQDYEREAYLDNEELEGEEIEIEAIGIEVDAHPIELYKLFKIANLVSGGGEAKHIIDEGYVAVNGELETRKRRKMYDGDFSSSIKSTTLLFATRQSRNLKRKKQSLSKLRKSSKVNLSLRQTSQKRQASRINRIRIKAIRRLNRKIARRPLRKTSQSRAAIRKADVTLSISSDKVLMMMTSADITFGAFSLCV